MYVVKANNIPPHNESIMTVNQDHFEKIARLVVSNTVYIINPNRNAS
jgi:hypothetical protein